MKKIIFLAIFALSSCFCFQVYASHLAGQDFTYALVDSTGGVYHYRVNLNLYQDCENGSPAAILADNPAFLAVYNGTGTLIRKDSVIYSVAHTMPITGSGTCATAGSSIPLCINLKTFVMDYYLPASTSGYNITYQRCCMNASVVNIADPGDVGISCYVSIPPSEITTHNNSAVFINYPPFVIPINTPLSFDFSATDADGDSLSYTLCNAYTAGSGDDKPFPPAAPPFDTLLYMVPFSSAAPMNCSAPLTIDPVTGLLTGTPSRVGKYLITICCHEWRQGLLINTTQREFEFTVLNCTLGTPEMPMAETTTLYPNPASTELTIVSKKNISSITISNITGQSIFDQNYNTKQAQVNIAGFPPGTYFVKINGTEIKKFVKK